MASKKQKLQVDLTIIVPAYHEEKRIGATLDELAGFLQEDELLKKLTTEVIVVSADSADKTHELVTSKSKQFVRFTLLKPGPKVGKGRDVQFGMLRANGKAVVFMDADLATPLKYLPRFYGLLQEAADVVAATRNLRKHHPSSLRRLISNMGNMLFRIAGGVWIEDSQCGFKMFNARAARICFSKLTIMGWCFDMEVLAIAKANGLKIKTVRVDDWLSVPNGTFAEGIMKNSLHSLNELAVIFYNRLNRKYLDEEVLS